MSASTISRKARLFFADKKRTAAEICIKYAQDFDSVRKGDWVTDAVSIHSFSRSARALRLRSPALHRAQPQEDDAGEEARGGSLLTEAAALDRRSAACRLLPLKGNTYFRIF